MIKGVNKRVIEINNPDSIYFEKAIFYLKPNVRELPSAVTEKEINRFVSELGLECYGFKKSQNTAKIFFTILLLLAVGGLLLAFI